MTVDVTGYRTALSEQKERGRASAQFGAQGTEGVQIYLDLLRDLKAREQAARIGRLACL